MGNKLYRKLAKNGMVNNRELYFPFTLASAGTFALFFIILSMATSISFAKSNVYAVEHIQAVLVLATIVVGLFATIFIHYSYSFLIRRRQGELALYQVLGMEKKHIRRILGWENFFLYFRSMVGAFIIGTLLYKLSEALLYRLADMPLSSRFLPLGRAFGFTALFGIFIYGGIYLTSRRKVQKIQPIAMMREAGGGEKPPKVNWINFVLSLVCLGVGYYLALTSHGPMESMKRFFVAVIFVMIGTELGFVAISVAVLKILQRKKSYYYQKEHFTTIGGLIPRMVKNGVGLANITIISTGVIILMSAATALYFGSEKMVQNIVPRDFVISVRDEDYSEIKDEVYQFLKKEGIEPKNQRNLRVLEVISKKIPGKILVETDSYFDTKGNMLYYFIPAADMREMGYDVPTGSKKAYAYGSPVSFEKNQLIFGDLHWDLEYQGKEFPVEGLYSFGFDKGVIVLSEEEEFQRLRQSVNPQRSDGDLIGQISFDTSLTKREERELYFRLRESNVIGPVDTTRGMIAENYNRLENYSMVWDQFKQFIGGIVFTGFFLGTVFLVALALIIYYKQLTEGYEDLRQYQVLQNVGMTKEEIKETVHRQVRQVFLLPLFVSWIHLAFAYPMIRQVLMLFYLTDIGLYMKSALAALVLFGGIYMGIYFLTSRTYYRIVTTE